MKKSFALHIIIALTVAVSIAATIYFTQTGEALLYRDAKSHLNIARRVFYSITPGVAQLGGVWLPVPHILMLPMVWSDYMYYSGLAGIIPSMLGFLLLSIFSYRIAFEVTGRAAAGVAASLVIITSPPLLYLQSTPMSEMVLLAASTGSIYFLIRWIKTRLYNYLIYSAIFILAATLTRYDGWFIFVCEIGVILLLTVVFRSEKKRSEGSVLLFSCLGGLGIVLWLLYNKLIFGGFLQFALGKGTGSWDASRVSSASTISSKGDIMHSFLTFSWMSVDNAGMVAIVLTVLGLIFFLVRVRRFDIVCGVLLLAGAYVFNIISLYLGLSIAYSTHVAPFETYNLRYGTAIIPLVAFVFGYLASHGKYAFICVCLAIALQGYMFFQQPLAIIADAQVGNNDAEVAVATWIREHPTKGRMLISTLSHDPLVFESHVSMKNIVYEGNREHWTNALRYPEAHISRVVLKSSDTYNDEVRRVLYGGPLLKKYFVLVYDHDYQVYDRRTQ